MIGGVFLQRKVDLVDQSGDPDRNDMRVIRCKVILVCHKSAVPDLFDEIFGEMNRCLRRVGIQAVRVPDDQIIPEYDRFRNREQRRDPIGRRNSIG